LTADPDWIDFQEGADVSNEIAVMVAGMRLRALGASVEIVRNAADSVTLVICIPSQSGELPRQNGGGTGKLDILLTEDCDDSYALTENMLRNENVYRARNGIEAIDVVKKHRFDVVFMDVHMPGIDGYTTLRAIREWETQTATIRTPIVILSSDDLETQKRSAAQSGCSGFLRKPLCESDLAGLVASFKTPPPALSCW